MLTRWPLVIEHQQPHRRRLRIGYRIAEALTGLVIIGAVIGSVFTLNEVIEWLKGLPLY